MEPRRLLWCVFGLATALCVHGGARAGASELVEGKFSSELVPSPVEYYALLPEGYDTLEEPVPLLYLLHGGNGDRTYLRRMQEVFEELWTEGGFSPLVVVTPSVTRRCFYMDYRDGSEKWESFLIGPFLEHLRSRFKLRRDRSGTFTMGTSMGGMGSLRLGFKHPDVFAAVMALEPGISPVLRFEDLRLRHRWWRSQELLETIYGKPVDTAYWAANNPASIVDAGPERLRAANLAIYLECGDEDFFFLDEATEFLHQILWKHGVPHEYHLVRGADHLGRTLRPRHIEALGFLQRVIEPPGPDPALETPLVRRLKAQRDQALKEEE